MTGTWAICLQSKIDISMVYPLWALRGCRFITGVRRVSFSARPFSLTKKATRTIQTPRQHRCGSWFLLRQMSSALASANINHNILAVAWSMERSLSKGWTMLGHKGLYRRMSLPPIGPSMLLHPLAETSQWGKSQTLTLLDSFTTRSTTICKRHSWAVLTFINRMGNKIWIRCRKMPQKWLRPA